MNYAQRPGNHECFDYHRDYVAKVPDGDILETLQGQLQAGSKFIAEIPPSQLLTVHPPYGWAIHTVIEHCLDAERIFGYRALRFATADATDLPGWNEQHYAACGYCQPMRQAELAAEFSSLRSANLLLLCRLKPDAWQNIGTADGRSVSVRTLAWLMAGHWLHHEQILRLRLAP